MQKRHLTPILLLILLLAPGLATANRYAYQARAQLAVAASTLSQYNFHETHEPFIGGYFPSKGIETFTIRLRAGTTYALIGTCDEDCIDIDLGLYTQSGRLLVKDVKTNDLPILKFQPQQTGTYQLKVAIPRCSARRCMFGVGVYGQTTAANPVRPDIINTGTLLGLMRDHPQGFVLVDARSFQDYRGGHIPSAVSLPHDRIHALSHYLPDNPSTLLVFYCWHTECGLSQTAAEAAQQLGYRNVAIYAAGIQGWRQAGYRLSSGSTI